MGNLAVDFVKQNILKIDWILPSFGVSLCKFIFSKNLLCQTVFLWSEFWVKRHLHKQIPQNRKIQSILWFFCFIKVAAEFPRILLHMKPKVRQIWRFLICVHRCTYICLQFAWNTQFQLVNFNKTKLNGRE